METRKLKCYEIIKDRQNKRNQKKPHEKAEEVYKISVIIFPLLKANPFCDLSFPFMLPARATDGGPCFSTF